MAAITITHTDLNALSRNPNTADALQDILLHKLTNGQINTDPHGTSFTITDPNADNDDHATARLTIAVRRQRGKYHRSTTNRTNREHRYTRLNNSDPHHHDPDINSNTIDPAITAALNTLPTNQRHAFIRHYLDDIPFTHIATELNTTPNNTRQLAHRARHTLNRNLTT